MPSVKLKKLHYAIIASVALVLLLVVLALMFTRSESAAPATAAPTANAPALPAGPNPVILAQQDNETQQALLQRYHGESTNATHTALVKRIGETLASHADAKDGKKPLHFHVLAEPIYIDIFAVPKGDVYVTTALVNRMRTEGQLAAALAHGAAHVLAGDRLDGTPQKFTVAQEAIADARTLKLMSDAGYDPQAYPAMLQILATAYYARADVTFFTTHPNADNRMAAIADTIRALFPAGVPKVLSK